MVFNIFKTETLLGIGIGFILSGVIIGFSPDSITNEEIIKQAKDFGMLTQEEHQALVQTEIEKLQAQRSGVPDTTGKSQANLDINQKQAENNKDILENNQGMPANNQEASGNVKDDTLSVPKQGDTEAGPVTAKETVKINIPRGSNSDKIAQILISAGVKTDLEGFQKAATEMRAQRKFQAGDFLIPLDGDIKQIIEILTHLPNA